jgi:hypothetical protein
MVANTFVFEYIGPRIDFGPLLRAFPFMAKWTVVRILRFLSAPYYVGTWHNGRRKLILFGTYRWAWMGRVHLWCYSRPVVKCGARFRHDIRIERNPLRRGKSVPARTARLGIRAAQMVNTFTYNLVNW